MLSLPPVVENLFRAMYFVVSVRQASESKISGHGVFTFSDCHERLFEHLQVSSAQPEGAGSRNQYYCRHKQKWMDPDVFAWPRTIFKAVHFKPQVCVRAVYGDIRTRAAVCTKIAKGNVGSGQHDLVA